MNRQRRLLDTRIYIVADFCMAALAWTLFFIYRKNLENGSIHLPQDLNDINYFYAVIIIPIGWILFYYIFDKYNDIYRLSRLATLTRTFFLSFMGVVFLFFTLILDDFIVNYRTYYQSFLTLFSLHFLLTVTSRMILLTRASHKLKAGLVTIPSSSEAIPLPWNCIRTSSPGLKSLVTSLSVSLIRMANQKTFLPNTCQNWGTSPNCRRSSKKWKSKKC